MVSPKTCNKCSDRNKKKYIENREIILSKQKEYQKNNNRSDYQKNYYKINKNKIIENQKTYYKNNKEAILEKLKTVYIENKKEFRGKNQLYYASNKEKILKTNNKYVLQKRIDNPGFRLRTNFSRSISRALNGSKLNKSILDYLQYSMEQLKISIEEKFEPWMTWENYGAYKKSWNDNDPTTWTWQIDHIIPQSDLPYSSMEDDNFRKCWNLDNLRPLSSKQNNFDGTNRVRHKK